MMGSFLTRALVMIFGYAYPAYECFKTVEKNKPEIEQLRFWCQYWILVALLTVFERIGDTLVSWVPMYSEAKLAFFIYLWYPKTKGTTYVYDSFFRPYIAKHETEIDHNLLELKTKAGDIAVLYFQKAASYGQTRVFEILQYVASQSTARSHPPQQQGAGSGHPPIRTRQADTSSQQLPPQQPPSRSLSAGVTQKQMHQPAPSRTSSVGAIPQQAETTVDTVSPPPLTSSAAVPAEIVSTSQHATQTDAEANRSLSNENTNETIMEEVTRVTRARLRKTRAAAAGKS